jgi:hypothetical protein
VEILDNTKSEILQEIQSKGYWKVVIRPEKFNKETISIEKLKEIIIECQVRQRGWPFPVIDRPHGKTFFGDNFLVSNELWGKFAEEWRFYQSGQFICYKGIVEDRIQYDPYSSGKNLEVIIALYTITEFFIFAKNLISKKILGDSIQIKIELFGTNNRKLIIADPFRHLHDDYICQIEHLTVFEGVIPITKLLADYDKIALESTMRVFNKFGWLNPDMEKVLKNDQEKILKGFF